MDTTFSSSTNSADVAAALLVLLENVVSISKTKLTVNQNKVPQARHDHRWHCGRVNTLLKPPEHGELCSALGEEGPQNGYS